MLGYFSAIGLARVQCLLGDFHLALQVLDQVELHKKVRVVVGYALLVRALTHSLTHSHTPHHR